MTRVTWTQARTLIAVARDSTTPHEEEVRAVLGRLVMRPATVTTKLEEPKYA